MNKASVHDECKAQAADARLALLNYTIFAVSGCSRPVSFSLCRYIAANRTRRPRPPLCSPVVGKKAYG